MKSAPKPFTGFRSDLHSNFRYIKSRYKIPESLIPLDCKPFNLSFPVSQDYKKSKNRVLVILGHVATEDLRNRKVLGGPEGAGLLDRIFQQVQEYANANGGKVDLNKAAFAFVNFNLFKSYHLDRQTRSKADVLFKERAVEIIDKLKPHTVIVFGDVAAAWLIDNLPPVPRSKIPMSAPGYSNAHHKRGWVFERSTTDGHKYKIGSTISYDKVFLEEGGNLEKAVAHVNVLGYVIRNVANVLNGEMLHKLDVKVKPVYVDTMVKFKKMMKVLDKAESIAVDTETLNLTVHHNGLVTIQFSTNRDKGYVVPVTHKSSPFTPSEIKEILSRLRTFFYTPPKEGRYLIMHNATFDIRVLRQILKIPYLPWSVWDTMAGEHGLDENLKILEMYGTPQFNLGQVILSYGDDFYLTAEFSKQDRNNLSAIDLDEGPLMYCAADSQYTYAVHEMQLQRAGYMKISTKEYRPYFERLVKEVYGSIVQQAAEMELCGHKVSIEKLLSKDGQEIIDRTIREVDAKMRVLPSWKEASKKVGGGNQTSLFGESADTLRLSKPDHKRTLFLDVLGLEPLTFSDKTGAPSIDKAFLAHYAGKVEEARLFLQISEASKLKSTYVEPFVRIVSEDPDGKTDHRIRARYPFTKVVTGRTSSVKPNMQNLPQHSELAKEIKSMFVADEGTLIVKFDFSASEVCWWGTISKDERLCSVFRKMRNLRRRYSDDPTEKNLEILKTEGDVHRMNYSTFSGKPVTEVTKDERQTSKVMTFGYIYGKSIYSIARDLDKPNKEMEETFRVFDDKYDKAAGWLRWSRKFSTKNLYTFSPLGRRRNLWGFLVNNEKIRNALERRAANSPIQGISSDNSYITTRILLHDIWKYMDKYKYLKDETVMDVKCTNMIHDSTSTEPTYEHVYLAVRAIESAAYKAKEHIRKIFGLRMMVPMTVDVEIGSSSDKMRGWDLTDRGLKEIIHLALKDKGETNTKKIMKRMFKHKERIDREFPVEPAQ